MGRREQLQNAARLAKEQSADFQRIADKGGEGVWDADAARGQVKVCQEMGDRFARELTKGKKR